MEERAKHHQPANEAIQNEWRKRNEPLQTMQGTHEWCEITQFNILCTFFKIITSRLHFVYSQRSSDIFAFLIFEPTKSGAADHYVAKSLNKLKANKVIINLSANEMSDKQRMKIRSGRISHTSSYRETMVMVYETPTTHQVLTCIHNHKLLYNTHACEKNGDYYYKSV